MATAIPSSTPVQSPRPKDLEAPNAVPPNVPLVGGGQSTVVPSSTTTTTTTQAANVTRQDQPVEEQQAPQKPSETSTQPSATATAEAPRVPEAVPIQGAGRTTVLPPGTTPTRPRAQFLIGRDPAINETQEQHQSLTGYGCMMIPGNTRMRGPMVVPRTINLWVALRGSTINLTEATFVHSVTTLRVFNVCGTVKLMIPRGVKVEASGFGLCGSVDALDDYSRDSNNPVPEAPLIRITGFSLCGGTHATVNTSVEPLVIVQHQLQGSLDQMTTATTAATPSTISVPS